MENDTDARNEDQAFYADGTQEVKECVRMTDKMSRLHSRIAQRTTPLLSVIQKMERRMEMAAKDILPPTLNVNIKTYYPLPAHQAPVHPKHPAISSCLQLPMPYTEPESLGDDQTKSASFGAHADGRKKEQLETLRSTAR